MQNVRSQGRHFDLSVWKSKCLHLFPFSKVPFSNYFTSLHKISYLQNSLTRLLRLHNMRYYEQKYPEVDELVMVQVRQIAEMGAYVKLVWDWHPNISPIIVHIVPLTKSWLARIRQHRRNDSTIRTFSSSYKISTETYQSRKERSCSCPPSWQRKGFVVLFRIALSCFNYLTH